MTIQDTKSECPNCPGETLIAQDVPAGRGHPKRIMWWHAPCGFQVTDEVTP